MDGIVSNSITILLCKITLNFCFIRSQNWSAIGWQDAATQIDRRLAGRMPQRPVSHRLPRDFASEKRCGKSAVDGTARRARVQAAGTWGSFSNYVTLWGGVGHVLHFVTWGEAMPVSRNGPVVRQFLALHAFHKRAVRATRGRLTRACFVHHFWGGSGAAVLRNLGGGSDRCYAPLLGGGVKNGQKSVT